MLEPYAGRLVIPVIVRDAWPVWRQLLSQPQPAGHHHPLTGTKLYCLSVTEARI